MAGYFDGDGGVGIRFGLFTVQLFALWCDTDAEQVQHLFQFLVSEGIAPEGPYIGRGGGKRRDAYILVVSEEGGLLQVLERLLPLVDKKRGQVEGAIRYLEDEITANQLVDVFNMAIKQSKRRPPKGKAEFEIPKIPFTRSKGRKMARSFSASKQKFKLKARFTADEIEQIKKDVLIRGIPSEVVALNHGLSGRSVRRLVRGTR